jgi:YHS domain-containing protein
VQGPEPYLNDFHIQLPCAVDTTAIAVLDPAHRAFVNHEVYFFSTEQAREQFEAEPWRFTGKVTDPVSVSRFQPDVSSPSRTAAGRLFYFESGETVAQFDQDPARYSTPKPTMQELK